MSILDTLVESGVTQEDLEKAASARLFAEAAAAEGIDLSALSEDQAEELYAFWADDAEKNASADAFIEAATAEGIDLNELTQDQVGELYDFWANGGEEKVASAEELLQEAAVKEASAKLAEAEYIGRYMARVYADELDKVADWKQTGRNAASRVGDAFKGSRLRAAIGATAEDIGALNAAREAHHAMHGNINKPFKPTSRGMEIAKGLGETGAAYGGAGLGAYGLYRGGKKVFGKKPEPTAEKQSSIDELIEERALEMILEAEIEAEAEKVAGDYIGGMAESGRAGEKLKAAKKSLMMTHDEREQLLREGHEGKASALAKKRLGSTILGGLGGALTGAGAGGAAHGRMGAAGGALLGGALGAGGAHMLSRMSEKLHKEKAGDRSALRAELARGVNTPHRLRQEHRAIADLVAAREGRGSGSGLLSVNINRGGGPSSGIKREAGTGEKNSSAFDLVVEERALELLKEAEESKSVMDRLKGAGGAVHGAMGTLGEKASLGRLSGNAAKTLGYGLSAVGTAGAAYGAKKLHGHIKAKREAEKQSSIDDIIEARALEMIEEAQISEEIDEAALELLIENGLV